LSLRSAVYASSFADPSPERITEGYQSSKSERIAVL
jgi:hypothetical protein